MSYIERQAAINMLKEADEAGVCWKGGYEQRHSDFEEAIDCINDLPAADVVPVVHGEWIRESWHSRTVRKCSNCHVTQTVTVYFDGKEKIVQYKYCPHCGAKMDKRREE